VSARRPRGPNLPRVATPASNAGASPLPAFTHEAFLYRDERSFVRGTASFVRAGLDAGEPVLVALAAPKIRRLREALGDDADAVGFTDMAVIGRNPGAILDAWYRFADGRLAGRRARGIGEPVSPSRRPAELVECQRHEQLLNLAFAGTAWHLMCPYDTAALPAPVIDGALASHPVVRGDDGRLRPSGRYRPGDAAADFVAPLGQPGEEPAVHHVDTATLSDARAAVRRRGLAAGLGTRRTHELELVVSELLTNSLCHGGGRATLLSWLDGDAVVHEVHDDGYIDDPLAGRRRPPADQLGGRGLWVVNQLSDLVQVRSSPEGTVVRVVMWR
jgi:anti-sigma regulatory factor (Ser/Thr protein kinase)